MFNKNYLLTYGRTLLDPWLPEYQHFYTKMRSNISFSSSYSHECQKIMTLFNKSLSFTPRTKLFVYVVSELEQAGNPDAPVNDNDPRNKQCCQILSTSYLCPSLCHQVSYRHMKMC